MKNWVFLSPVFWKVLIWGLIADWGSKAFINLLIEPVQFKESLYPSGHVAITHFEHWREHWYDLEGIPLHVYNLVERITPFDVSMALFLLTVLLGLPLLYSLSSIRQKHPQVGLSVGLGCWFAALFGNKVELWLFGHATDWIFVRFFDFVVVTNLADVLVIAAVVTFWGLRR